MIKMHDYSACHQRNWMRSKEKWVPDDVIDRMIQIYQDPSPETAKRFDKTKIEDSSAKTSISSRICPFSSKEETFLLHPLFFHVKFVCYGNRRAIYFRH